MFFLLLLALIQLGCNSNIENPSESLSIEKIKKRGKLIAITGFNAYSYFIYKGKTMGYEYELLKRFADRLGVDVEIKVSKDINEMFDLLEKGEGDLIAFNLTVTKERKEKFDFTSYFNITNQVLVQRKPKNWRRMTMDQISDSLIRNPIDLEYKTVYTRKGSVYKTRLENLSEEIGGHIEIIEAQDTVSIEDLIEKVANGEIDYTVSDENVAELNLAFYPNIDIETYISFPQKIAWVVRKGSNDFLEELNTWIEEFKKDLDFYVIYDRYYKYRNYYKARRSSKYFLSDGGGISQYDKLIQKYADSINWDWRLLASMIYQESNFKPDTKSWAGAVGLMQLLPETGNAHGAEDLLDPEKNIRAGANYIKWLDNFWAKYVEDKDERVKFILASYNIGFGHIEDARRLAEKYGGNPNVWSENVADFLLKKSKPKYYNDEVVKNGYSNGRETVAYVKKIMQRYDRYVQFVGLNPNKKEI
ncbi:MAG: transporter substrate-binding domain-containing protein [Ignavibacteriales bacterium]|nr:transporter substrate-binding domain-containing protein [Ignavibacteriales bacterium]MCB9258102.1 transporter substrate-binding domain-containing protein [Ignavibacteriales bacterium]